jgi:chromosome segregation ATPase
VQGDQESPTKTSDNAYREENRRLRDEAQAAAAMVRTISRKHEKAVEALHEARKIQRKLQVEANQTAEERDIMADRLAEAVSEVGKTYDEWRERMGLEDAEARAKEMEEHMREANAEIDALRLKLEAAEEKIAASTEETEAAKERIIAANDAAKKAAAEVETANARAREAEKEATRIADENLKVIAERNALRNKSRSMAKEVSRQLKEAKKEQASKKAAAREKAELLRHITDLEAMGEMNAAIELAGPLGDGRAVSELQAAPGGSKVAARTNGRSEDAAGLNKMGMVELAQELGALNMARADLLDKMERLHHKKVPDKPKEESKFVAAGAMLGGFFAKKAQEVETSIQEARRDKMKKDQQKAYEKALEHTESLIREYKARIETLKEEEGTSTAKGVSIIETHA